jgi:WD40 repeat protein
MPIPLKPPNRVDPLNFPVFGISWFGNPGNGLSLVAYCGGGGSAKTGVNNAILIRAPDGDTRRIDTGDDVGVALKIVQDPQSGFIFLMVALGKRVVRYSLPGTEMRGVIDVGGEGVNAINVNNMVNIIACGCESGEVKVYKISDDQFDASNLLYVCKGHTSTVCSLDFSCVGGRMVSSAKDGTARVWSSEGESIAELKCSIEGGKQTGKKTPKNASVLVRGCAFGDMEGRVVFTVASGRRGSAFLAGWQEGEQGWQCERLEISDVPISAMSLSTDGRLLTLGSVDGSVILFGVDDWKPLKSFKEVHDLPVTCIAARPFDVPLQGEEDGVRFHALSASADSKLAHLSLQRRAPKQSKPGAYDDFFKMIWNTMLFMAIAYLVLLRPLYEDAIEKCSYAMRKQGVEIVLECLLNDVLIAPNSHPGVSGVPY